MNRDRSQGHGSVIHEIEAVWHHETESDAMKKTITVLKDEVRRLESEVKSLQQGQDFRSYYAEAGTSHDKLQRQLRNIRQEIIAWSRVIQRDLLNISAIRFANMFQTVNQKAAKMWQSACLKMYDLSDEFGSEREKETAHKQSIDDIIFMISKALGIEDYGQVNHPKLRSSVSLAVDIGKELGQSLSGLVPMNKGWLHEHADRDGYISASTMGSRIEPRYPPDEGRTIVKGKVALVLFPGLLKYGSDDGEHWDSWTVWIPAKVHLMDEQIEETPKEAPDQHVYQPPTKIARSDHGMERNGSQDTALKPNRERSITQSNRKGSRTRDTPPSDEDYHLVY
ncbi:hypothetical protein FPCIR_868 [Fusarium pseudocircinatum]|uniref:Uncharacterized protein n=1 Tax=Fusarium pseudocircinatum TaxID=56676 RepID=A0A8H5UZY0_9HYPO|nr:hypothetical protein FPCIR_868 [Fusarium pseudocircinatum]